MTLQPIDRFDYACIFVLSNNAVKHFILITTILYAMKVSDINFQPLCSELTNRFGVWFAIETDGNKKPKVNHPSILNQFGMLEMVAKDITVDFFNFSEDEDGYWMNLYLWIYPKDGGAKGLEFMTAYYKNGLWDFECK